MASPTISVIIPVYNTARWLDHCLESVLGQTFRDIEVLCVDDGSYDSSPDLLRRWALKDKRIKVISFQENKGVSAARNAGISNATGQFIGFVDSDDFVDKHFFMRLLDGASRDGSDMAKGTHLNYCPDNNRIYQHKAFDLNDRILGNKAWFYFSFYSAIYRTDFIRYNKISFPEDLTHFEDPVFSVQAAVYCNKVTIVDNAFYYYTERPDSMMRRGYTLRHVSDLHQAVLKILGILEDGNVDVEHYRIVLSFLAGQLMDWVSKPFVIDEITEEAALAFYDLCLKSRDPRILIPAFFIDRKHDYQAIVLRKLREM